MTKEMGVVIMAGGMGSRMRCSSVHKVCFPLGGKPVINRNIELFNNCGIKTHFIVVRHLAEQVMQTVASTDGTHFFCYQKEPKGTGNAAKTAGHLISKISTIEDIMVVAGDKIIEEKILCKLIEKHKKTDSDLTLLVGKIKDFPGSGRIIYSQDNSISGIIEVLDIRKAELLNQFKKLTSKKPLSSKEAKKIILTYISNEKKIEIAIGPLWKQIKKGKPITSNFINKNFSEEDFLLKCNHNYIPIDSIKKVKHTNLSVYLFKREAFLTSLNEISDNNAQKEEYLTDTIGVLANKGAKIDVLPIDKPSQVMAFNTPEEIYQIEKKLVEKNSIIKEKPSYLKSPLDWLRHLETVSPVSLKYFRDIYGNNYPYIENKIKLLTAALKDYMEHFGNNPVIIVRAPGRINIMGRHIDHQGGDVNMVAIDKDIYCIMGERNDRQVFANSMEPYRFPERRFSIDSLNVDYEKKWHEFINNSFLLKQFSSAKKDWGRYIKSVLSRFQHFNGKTPVKGMNIMVSGDLPIEGGISSSSALFMAVAEGCTYLNNLTLSPYKFIELCDEGEEFLGNRIGTGDHAAIKYSKRGHITHIGISPFQIIKSIPFPPDYLLAICNSQFQAYKTRGAKEIYNHRVACYHIGKELLKQNFPYIADFVIHLRDIVYGKGNLSEKDILEMLKSLPIKMSRKEIYSNLKSEKVISNIESIPSHIDNFPIREILIYGLSECIRSRFGGQLLLKDNIFDFGKLMNISHNGDRVAQWIKDMNYAPYSIDYSDKTIEKLISNLPEKDNQLMFQTGGYRCSTQEIDRMIDISLKVKNVVGAQISGAGLGGYIMVLVKEDSYEELESQMLKHYYESLNLGQEMFIAYPVEGSGLVYF